MIISSLTLTGKEYDVRLSYQGKDHLRGEVLEPGKRGKRVRSEFNLHGVVTTQDVWANILPHLDISYMQGQNVTLACEAILTEIRRLGARLV